VRADACMLCGGVLGRVAVARDTDDCAAGEGGRHLIVLGGVRSRVWVDGEEVGD